MVCETCGANECFEVTLYAGCIRPRCKNCVGPEVYCEKHERPLEFFPEDETRVCPECVQEYKDSNSADVNAALRRLHYELPPGEWQRFGSRGAGDSERFDIAASLIIAFMFRQRLSLEDLCCLTLSDGNVDRVIGAPVPAL